MNARAGQSSATPRPRRTGRGRARLAATRLLGPLAVATLVAGALLASAASAAPPAEFGGPEGSGAGEFSGANGIAVDQATGDSYLVDRNNSRVEGFGPDGEFLLAFGWGVADGAAEPQTCGPDASPPTAGCQAALEGSGPGQMKFPEGIAVDNSGGSSEGDLYVVDTRNSRIEKFGPGGDFIAAFGEEGAGPGQFGHLEGRAVAVGPAGNVFVSDEDRVQRFSPAGALEAQIPISGAGRIPNLAVDSAGDLYLKAGELPGVRKFDQAGAELGGPRDAAGEPSAIAIGPADQLIVNDANPAAAHHLLSFAAGGIQIASFDAGHEGGEAGIAHAESTGLVYLVNLATIRTVGIPAPGPLIFDQRASAVEPRSAILEAQVNPEGAASEYRFEYGLADCAGGGCTQTPVQSLPAGFEDRPVEAAIEGLEPRTAYHFRVVAVNAAGEERSPDQTFTTAPPVSIEATSVSRISATAATLEAELDPHGLEATYRFEVDTSPYGEGEGPHGRSVPLPEGVVGPEATPVPVSAKISGLLGSTVYHYRVVAQDTLGTVDGEDRTFTTQGLAASVLPDGRQWEQVSPIDKHGQPIETIGSEAGNLIQASAAGSAISYGAKGPLLGDPLGNTSLAFSQSFSQRTGTGWTTAEIASPHEGAAVGASTGYTSEYKVFSSELDRAVVEPEGEGLTPLSPEATERTPYVRNPDGSFTPLVTAQNVPEGVKFGLQGAQGRLTGVEFAAANASLSQIVVSAPQALTGDFSPAFEPVVGAGGTFSLYGWSNGVLRLESLIPPVGDDGCGGNRPACVPSVEVHEELLGGAAFVGVENADVRNAVSSDGTRIVFTAGRRGIYLRDDALHQTVLLDAAAPGGHGAVEPRYQFADQDDSRIFFTDSGRLTSDSTAREDQPDLYMCEVVVEAGELGCHLKDLTVDRHRGEAADIRWTVIGGAEDGRNIYFVADGALTPNASAGTCENGRVGAGEEEACNLYEVETASGATRLIARLSIGDGHDWNAGSRGGTLQELTARVSPNGRYLAFMSLRGLTGYDSRDALSGERDEEVYLFDGDSSAHELSCVSCNPTGARPHGIEGISSPGLLVDHFKNWEERWIAAQLPGWTNFGTAFAQYQSRYLSDSGRLYFTSSDALVPQDSNGKEDVYQYEPVAGSGMPESDSCTAGDPGYQTTTGGCVDLISSGASEEESVFLDASESGDDVFFLSSSRLASTDVDGALDVYDAHACSASSPCPPAPAPSPPACEGDACQPPATPPLDATPGSLTFNGAGNLLQCRKGKVKKGDRCVKKHRKTAKHKQKKHSHKARTPKNHARAGSRRGGTR